jgi:hypothetical protein
LAVNNEQSCRTHGTNLTAGFEAFFEGREEADGEGMVLRFLKSRNHLPRHLRTGQQIADGNAVVPHSGGA